MHSFYIKKAAQSFDIDLGSYTEAVREAIVTAGLQRILNDLVAGTKPGDESVAAVRKKLDAWARGEVRTVAQRTSDPVAKRVGELILGSKGFIAWAQANGLKVQSKDASAKLRELVAAAMAKGDESPFVVKARRDVAEAEELDVEI